MPKEPCKGTNKDGSPCRGQGLPRFNGYCIAHAPSALVREWRIRGGKNSSTAARADKRMPERLRRAIETLDQGLIDLREGKIMPAAFSAMCRGVRTIEDLHRLAEEEMEQIRNEEAGAVAREIVNAQGDPAILDAAAQISAQEEQFRMESLIKQGVIEVDRTAHGDDQPQYRLTEKGRRRFGLQQGSRFAQHDVDQIKRLLENPEIHFFECVDALNELTEMRVSMEEAIEDLSREPPPVRDPITGDILTRPPPGVRSGTWYAAAGFVKPESARRTLKKQLEQVVKLARIFEARIQAQQRNFRLDMPSRRGAREDSEDL